MLLTPKSKTVKKPLHSFLDCARDVGFAKKSAPKMLLTGRSIWEFMGHRQLALIQNSVKHVENVNGFALTALLPLIKNYWKHAVWTPI
jgi:L-2-hydroxyglutarate oxidase LhgO